MPSRSGPQFLHHHQQDGSWQSICPACELSIVIDDREDALTWLESFHFCDPDRLHELTLRPNPTPDLSPPRSQRLN